MNKKQETEYNIEMKTANEQQLQILPSPFDGLINKSTASKWAVQSKMPSLLHSSSSQHETKSGAGKLYVGGNLKKPQCTDEGGDIGESKALLYKCKYCHDMTEKDDMKVGQNGKLTKSCIQCFEVRAEELQKMLKEQARVRAEAGGGTVAAPVGVNVFELPTYVPSKHNSNNRVI